MPIIPTFVRNAEEMRFNPIFFFFNYIGFTRLFWKVAEMCASNNSLKPLGWVLKQIGLNTWFALSWWAIPIPVKTTAYVGEPIYFKADDDLHYITETCRKALQDLISKRQPHKHNYLVGLKERFGFCNAEKQDRKNE